MNRTKKTWTISQKTAQLVVGVLANHVNRVIPTLVNKLPDAIVTGCCRVSIRDSENKGDVQVSLCWQNLDPLEDSLSADTSHARPPDTNNQSEAGHVIVRLVVRCRRLLFGLSDPTPAGTGMERIRTTK
jgi:hypothetical protein